MNYINNKTIFVSFLILFFIKKMRHCDNIFSHLDYYFLSGSIKTCCLLLAV